MRDQFRYGAETATDQLNSGGMGSVQQLRHHLAGYDAVQRDMRLEMHARLFGQHVRVRHEMEQRHMPTQTRLPALA